MNSSDISKRSFIRILASKIKQKSLQMYLRQLTPSIIIAVSVLIAGCTMSPDSAQPVTPFPTTTAITTTLTTTVAQMSSAAVRAARLRLAKNGLENPDLVSVIRITSTTWLDDCLGLPSDKTCHPQATPGYLIELERDGQRYLFHTDQDGKQVRLAWSSITPLSEAFVQWQYSDAQECKTAVIGVEQMRFGRCGEAMLAASSRASMWPDINGQSQASYLKQKYAPFTANTIRGTLVFTGTGTIEASEAEQRAIAEWALTRFIEANANYLPADYGLNLFWHEESTSFCGGLWIYQTGLAVAWNCDGSAALGAGFLSATQLQQFYRWLDSGKQWDVVRNGQVEGKPFNLTLQFASSNTVENATAEDVEDVLQFAREVYMELTDKVPKK